MTNFIVLTLFILSILNSILFYGESLGLNVILFIIPFVIFIYYVLKNNKKIINKKGLLFIIPIIILASTYFIYDNGTFKFLNGLMMIIFFLFLYIYTINPVYKLGEIFSTSMSILFEPFNRIGNFRRIVKTRINESLKLSDKNQKIIKAVLIVLPITFLVILLLASADEIFNNLFSGFINLITNISIERLLERIILILIFFIYVGATLNYILFGFKSNKEEKEKKYESTTINLLLTTLNVIYVIFDFIQIKSLILHHVSKGIIYSEYARQGFFQLMLISLINLIIILVSKRIKEKDNKYTKVMSILMVVLTLIIIASSFMRMYMYESAYGYTTLRLLVYFILITETILLIPTIRYILNSKINVMKHYLIICTVMYTVLAILPVNYIIAKNNVDRYYKKNKIDLLYLKNYDADNIEILIELSKKTKDKYMKENLNSYFKHFKNYKNDIREFNISKYRAKKLVQKK